MERCEREKLSDDLGNTLMKTASTIQNEMLFALRRNAEKSVRSPSNRA